MKIDILTLFPEMFDGFLTTSIMKRALDKKLLEIHLHDFRLFSKDKHHKVDDVPYGGGAGMVLACQPVLDCLKAVRTADSFVILLSPQGVTFNQGLAQKLSVKKHLILICGHYEGFDERIRAFCDLEISLGDYILTGGELGSMVISDAVCRLLDGAINAASPAEDSFSDGLLEYPQYTRPPVYAGMAVPEVLLSGHHEKIRQWRLQQALQRTYERRFDLLENRAFTKEELKLLYPGKND